MEFVVGLKLQNSKNALLIAKQEDKQKIPALLRDAVGNSV
jgi:hypothetical protein